LQVEDKNAGSEFFKLVHHCAVKCQTANASFCYMFAAYLNKTAEHYKQVLFPSMFFFFVVVIHAVVSTICIPL
jgi:hypothetical protein